MKPNITIPSKLEEEIAQIAYEIGKEDEKKKHFSIPNSMVITMVVKNDKDEIETIREVLSFEEIKSGRKIIEYKLLNAFAKIATQGILKKLITS